MASGLFSDIQSFSKNHLKKTDTLLTTPDGSQYTESRDKYGRIVKTKCESSNLGFVGDTKPDLQVAEILEGLVMGSQDVAADFELLQASKVTHILNCASMVDNLFPDDFTYLYINILDLPETQICQHFRQSFAFISEGIASGGRVLVHCNAGVSRSATIVIAYVMNKCKLNFAEAFELVKNARPAIRPNEGFRKQLKEFSPDSE